MKILFRDIEQGTLLGHGEHPGAPPVALALDLDADTVGRKDFEEVAKEILEDEIGCPVKSFCWQFEDCRAERQRVARKAAEKAAAVWKTLDKNRQTAIRFGVFPKEVVDAAEGEGVDSHEFCIALMDCASKNGGMRA